MVVNRNTINRLNLDKDTEKDDVGVDTAMGNGGAPLAPAAPPKSSIADTKPAADAPALAGADEIEDPAKKKQSLLNQTAGMYRSGIA